MAKISNPHIAELLLQMRFTTESQKLKQLDAAERLLKLVDPARDYPFEFVVYQITGYRPKGAKAGILIGGQELASDLQVFIARLSSLSPKTASEEQEKVFHIDELADHLGVATKTINRWRKRGLIAKKYLYADGKKRFGFSQSCVDEFTKSNPALIERAGRFNQLDKQEKSTIIKRSIVLAQENMSRSKIIAQIARECGRAIETVRYTILNYQTANPSKVIFKKPLRIIKARDAAAVYKQYLQGQSISELMAEFGKSKSSIYRIINGRRARELMANRIEYIESHEFADNTAAVDPESMAEYLCSLADVTVLNREQEIELFKRYNYLKYLASMERSKFNISHVFGKQLRRIETLLLCAQKIQKKLIESNLGLVVSIANKHGGTGANAADLISEGNFSLLRAVEKFDYTRGFRFSTYASWAIAKDFARKIPAEAARLDRAGPAEFEHIQKDYRMSDSAGVAAVEKANKSLEQVITENLNEREQHIIRHHFGLMGSRIKRKGESLKQIGDELGLSKERVRQLELAALQKLRHSLSPEEFELLTG